MSVLVASTVFGTLMFLVEGPDNGFTSIPQSIYWTIVTITTVGYGDITPHTVIGKMISTAAMLDRLLHHCYTHRYSHCRTGHRNAARPHWPLLPQL